MRLLKRFLLFIMSTMVFLLLIAPFILGFWLKLLATGFYAGMEQADKFLRKY